MSVFSTAMEADLTRILEKSLSPDPAEQREAREYLEAALHGQHEALTVLLSQITAATAVAPVVRMQAGLQLKNIVFSNDLEQKAIKQAKWLSLPPETRLQIKINCFSALGTQEQGYHSAAQCVAYIACAEIVVNQWPDVIRMLVENITAPEATESLKQASLESLGYICNEIDANILASQADEILTGIVCGLKKEEQSTRVKKAAANALLNSLDFTRDNFNKENERNYLMQVVCESTQCHDIDVAVVGLQCLVKIMSQYYCHMEHYMARALFAISVEAMKHQNDAMILQGIEFWSTVCEEELELTLEAEELRERGNVDMLRMNSNKNYARGAIKFLVPILLEILAKQEEGDDEDEWNPHKAAGVCLALLAQTCEEMIVELVVPFVQANINHVDWRLRDAAVMAFGSILEGPSRISLESLVRQAMEVIINLLTDACPVVRDTAAWTVGRVCEVLPEVPLNDQCLPALLQAMVTALSSEARVATNVCWALGSLAEGAYNVALKNDVTINGHNEPQSYTLSPYFANLVDQLFATANRPDCGQSNLRNAAYSALMELTKSAPRDCYPCIQKTTMIVLGKLESLLQVQDGALDTQDKVQLDEFQSLLCGTLQSVLRKITSDDVQKILHNVMMVLVPMLQRAQAAGETNRYSGVQEDALLAVSALIDSIGTNFNNYLPEFMKVLIPCLLNVSEHQICANAVGVIGDLTRNVGPLLEPYLSTVFQIMDGTLRNPGTQRSLLPLIISTYGDFALVLGDVFSPYRPQVLETLQQACQAEVDLSDPDMVDYLNSLRGSCIDTFVGLIQGGRGTLVSENMERLSFIIPHIDFIVKFIEHVGSQSVTSDEVLGSCCGLVGDIITAFGKDSLSILNTDGINNLLNKARSYKNASTKKYALWALKEMKKLKETP